MMQGDILFIKNKGFWFKGVRDLINGEYDHVGLVVADNSIVDVALSGVRISTWDKFLARQAKEKFEFKVYRCDVLTERDTHKIAEYAVSKVGMKYDYIQLLCMMFYIVFDIKRKVKPLDTASDWTCCELVVEAYGSVGVKFDSEVNQDNLTSADMIKSSILREVIS
jgi:uncharacterized protein YycO